MWHVREYKYKDESRQQKYWFPPDVLFSLRFFSSGGPLMGWMDTDGGWSSSMKINEICFFADLLSICARNAPSHPMVNGLNKKINQLTNLYKAQNSKRQI